MIIKLILNACSLSYWRRLVSLTVLLFFVQTTFAADDLPNRTTEETLDPVTEMTVMLREHGYTLGDSISMQAKFTLKNGLLLDRNSVPLVGPINSWLDLSNIEFHEDKNEEKQTITLDFTWQVFGTVKEAQQIKIPEIILQTLPPETDEDVKPFIITLPQQAIYLSPVLPEQLGSEESSRTLIPPPRFDTATPMKMALLYLLMAMLLAGFWLWLQDKLTWFPRYPGAMTLLARQLRHQQVAKKFTLSETDLRTIHAGLAGSAGQSLYPNTLNTLFENSPYLIQDKNAITLFFNNSWSLFHGKNTAINVISVPETLAWVKRAAMAERLFRYAARKNISQ